MWVRGLKRSFIGFIINTLHVAPRVGAWIETLEVALGVDIYYVSHPVWVRGLKHVFNGA